MAKGYVSLNWASYQLGKTTSGTQQLQPPKSADQVKSLSLDYVDVTGP